MGMQNTLDIVKYCSANTTAAYESLSYSYSGYNDWFLPSLDELILLRGTIGQGSELDNPANLSNSFYWTSTQYNSQMAYRLNATTGFIAKDSKK